MEIENTDSDFHIKCGAILLTWIGDEVSHITSLDILSFELDERLQNSAKWTMCIEKESKLHCHLFTEGIKQYDHTAKYWAINGLTPNVQCNKVTGSGARPSRNQGHFYCFCPYKNSHIESESNWRPGDAYAVKTQWPLLLWQKGKLDRLIECAAHYGCLTPSLEAQYRLSITKRKQIQKAVESQERTQRIKSRFKPDVPDVIKEWLATYADEQDRYKFFIIYGESWTGKTTLAKSLFKNPYIHEDSICWKGYDDDKHDAIIFDDVADIYKYISRNHRLFQAGSCVATQTSATNVHSLHVDVTQKPIMILCNERPTDQWTLSNSYRHKALHKYSHPLEIEPLRESVVNVIDDRPSRGSRGSFPQLPFELWQKINDYVDSMEYSEYI